MSLPAAPQQMNGLPRSYRVFGVALCLVLSLAHFRSFAATGSAISDEFLIDTGGHMPSSVSAISPEFQIDTGGRVPAVASSSSLDFVVNTRDGATGYSDSAFLTIDTRGAGTLGFIAAAKTTQGSALPGVTVSVLQNGISIAARSSDDRGLATFGGLFGGYYELRAQKLGYLTQERRHVRLPEDLTGGLTFILPTPPATPVAEASSTIPPESLVNPPQHPSTAILRVFGGTDGVWGPFKVDPAKMTVVMTHGCDSNPREWALAMARKMAAIPTLTDKVNIVAWDWEVEAATVVPAGATLGTICVFPRQVASDQGVLLGEALRKTLGVDYNRPVHFIGHSLGTLVNSAAANLIHNDDPYHFVSPAWHWQNTHVTLFDETRFLPNVRLDWDFGWSDPIPERLAYVDNYISAVGRVHQRGVDVLLPEAVFDHGYPCEWYQETIELPRNSELGFRYSFEYAAVQNIPPNFPVPIPWKPGSLFRQNLILSDPLRLIRIEKPEELPERTVVKLAEFGALYGATEAGLWTYNRGVEAVEITVDTLAAAARKTGDVTLRVVESVFDSFGDSALYHGDPQFRVSQTTPAILEVPGLLEATTPRSAYTLRLDLSTRPPLVLPGPQSERNALPAANEGSENTPAYVWLPLTVPAFAVGMTFDFRLNGHGMKDRVVAGIGASNLFNVRMEFLGTNTWRSSGLLPVEAWAGKDVELFFGVAGGTSTNANLTVQNIRFVGIPRPILEVLRVDSETVLTWPDVSAGYVLESSRDLGKGEWSPITNVGAYSSQRVYTNNLDSEKAFYRLTQP